MTTGSVKGATYTLKELFERHFYGIDYYQREYAWSADDVRTLVDDLIDAFDQSWQGGNRKAHHANPDRFFLGPFVFVDEPRQRRRFLVDGQQRFTTLHLIFMHLRRTADALKDRESEDNLRRVIGESDKGRIRFRIDIDDRRALLEAIYNGTGFESRPTTPISVRNMASRSDLIAELLDSRLTSEACHDFVDWLLKHVLLVGIKAGDKASGFKIFESMNDRGARLTPADLVKSFLISRATSYEEELNQRWRDMLAKVTIDREDANAPKEYLKAVLIAHYARLGEDDGDAAEIDESLSTWVRKNYQTRLRLKGPRDFFQFLDDLLYLSEHYVRYMKATKRAYFDQNLETLFYNNANGLSGQLAAVLAPIKPRDTDPMANAKAALVSNYIDRLYVSRLLSDEPLGNRDFNDEFRRIIPSLRECETTDDVIAVLAPSIPADSFDILSNFRLRGNNRSQVRYFLARLTAYVEVGLNKPDVSEKYLDGSQWHIEHLWPINQELRPQDYKERVEFRLARSRIGALTLLPGRDNEAYQDLSFDKKVGYYGRQPNLTAVFWQGHLFRNTVAKEFAAKNSIVNLFHDFGSGAPIPEVIRSRTALYKALANRVWDPIRIGFPAKPVIQTAVSDEAEPVEARAAPKLRPKPSPGAALTRLVKAGIIAADTELVAAAGGYSAIVDKDGIIWLPTGDAFNAVDEAGKAVSGQPRCNGLQFWQVRTADGLLSIRALRDKAQANGRLGSTSRPR
jgi:uncharacterized protein with ParB-like and HNH nuclease domain